MSSTVVFDVFPAVSHYNTSFSLATFFKTSGYRVVYVGSEAFRNQVTENGFEYFAMKASRIFPDDRETLSRNGAFRELVKHYLHKRVRINRMKAFIANKLEYHRAINVLDPRLIILDSQNVLHAVLLKAWRVKYILLQTKLSSVRHWRVAPLNAYQGVSRSYYLGIRAKLLWHLVLVRRMLLITLLRIIYLRLDVHSICSHILEKTGVKANQFFDYTSDFVVGCKQAREILTAPPSFDYNRPLAANQFHFVGVHASSHRREIIDDNRYKYLRSTILSDRSKTHIFCSLGTVSHLYQDRALAFYRKILKVAEGLPDCNFILSIDRYLPLQDLDLYGENVFTFDYLPQLDILQRTNLVVSSGGLNTIKECVYYGVPMLIYPVTEVADQPGNALRVKQHGLGDYGRIRIDSVATITRKITDLLRNRKTHIANLAGLRKDFFPEDVTDNHFKMEELLKNVYGEN